MLKNAREYLEEELNFYCETLNEHKETLAQIKKEYEDGQNIATTYEEKVLYQKKLFIRFILDMILGGPFVILGFHLGVPFMAAILIVLLVLPLSFSIKQAVSASRKFKKTYKESEYPFKSCFKKNYDYKRFFKVRYEESIPELEEWIKNNKEYVCVLWETLSSDDFLGMLEKYHEYWIIVEALKSEWEAYIEEISQIRPEDVHFDKEALINIEPVSINHKPKNEKKYNLAIK